MSILWMGAIILTEETHCANLTFTFVLALGQIFLSCSVLFFFLSPLQPFYIQAWVAIKRKAGEVAIFLSLSLRLLSPVFRKRGVGP